MQENKVTVCNDAVMPRIEIKTPYGTLVACAGGDPADYPEIFIYIRRADGIEIDLLAAGIDVANGNVKGYIYGDTTTDVYTEDVFWTKDEINREV